MGRFARAALVTAAVAGGIAALTAYSRRVVRRAEEEFPAEGRLVELANGAVIHVVDLGSGDPVVFIHGADGVGRSFTATVASELAAGRRVLVVDRPGHGYSTLPEGMRACVECDATLIRDAVRLLGVEAPLVVGHSYGGAVAMRWALDHPGELPALVLLAPVAGYPWWEPVGLLAAVNAPVVGRLLTDALVVPVGRLLLPWLSRRAFSPQDVPQLYTAYSSALFLRPSQFRVLAQEYVGLRADVAEIVSRFGELTLPVEIVSAERDLVTRPEHHARPLARALPDARLTELPGTGHELLWPRPDAVVAAIERAEARMREQGGAQGV